MALDSPAAFTERIAELGLEAHTQRFELARWTPLAALAFSSPRGRDEKMFAQKVLVPGLGDAAHPYAHKLRRLFFEAFMLASADLKQRVGSTTADGPRKIPDSQARNLIPTSVCPGLPGQNLISTGACPGLPGRGPDLY